MTHSASLCIIYDALCIINDAQCITVRPKYWQFSIEDACSQLLAICIYEIILFQVAFTIQKFRKNSDKTYYSYWTCYEVSRHVYQVRNWLINRGYNHSSSISQLTSSHWNKFILFPLVIISFLNFLMVADRRSSNNYSQSVQMHCPNRYTCSRYSEAFPLYNLAIIIKHNKMLLKKKLRT